MIDSNKILHIPHEEKLYIKPEVRQALLKEIITEYPKRYPNLKLIYAAMNHDPKCPIDYTLVFKTMNNTGTIPLIVYDGPLLYADRSVPGYRYCKRMKIEDKFYLEGVKSMTTIPENRFYEYIENMIFVDVEIDGKMNNILASNDSKSLVYWKKEDFIVPVIKGLFDLSLRYVKR